MAYTYVIRSIRDKKLYIGSTENIARRFKEHNSGKNVSTRHRRPFELVYVEEFNTTREAKYREKQFKKSHSVLYKAAEWKDNHK